jgi:NAD(P)H-flavin reductase/hemoglobin-like flavoprotein
VAIALDGGVPDYGADRPAAQSLLGIFKRQRESLPPQPPSPTSLTPAAGGRPAVTLAGLARPCHARTESIASDQAEDAASAPAAGFDARLVKESFAHVSANASLAMEYFYSHLFTASPESRAMFPMSMRQIRQHVFTALTRLVWTLDSPGQLTAYLSQLGRDHRKYGVKDKHYDHFFTALMETAQFFSGADWTAETAAAWAGALTYATRMMRSAAAADARDHPPWWVGEIVAHDRRSETVAVLTIQPDAPLPYRAGQYVPVQVTRWPRVWRPYSIANAPRADGLIDLHVRAVPGGMVSTTLVRHAAVGDAVLLGPADGELSAPDNDRDLLCVAGGTGLAPIKAIVQEVAGRRPRASRPRRITLFAGARRQEDLYDLGDLQAMQSSCPGLQVIPVLSDESTLSGHPAILGLTGMTGLLPDVVRGHGLFENSEACICGPAAMVRQTALLLAAHVTEQQIHYDPLPSDDSRAGFDDSRAGFGDSRAGFGDSRVALGTAPAVRESALEARFGRFDA